MASAVVEVAGCGTREAAGILMARTLEHDVMVKTLRETTRRLQQEVLARQLGFEPVGWRNGRLVVRIPARIVEKRT